MVTQEGPGRTATVRFTGARSDLFGILFRGYLQMVPTIGVYRFWLTTWKRRFFWSNTEIDGDVLEYTGNAMQLLIGFLYAVVVFLPLYGLFFYLQTQSNPNLVLAGFAAVGGLLWFLSGYAIYRARDFRLSRTLWRGIRFDQGGSAWGYAFRRFGWSILMVLTIGLVYPLMAANLWRYRYIHTWFGDRKFAFTGRARQLAGPYYLAYFVIAALSVITVTYFFAAPGYALVRDVVIPDATATILILTTCLFTWLFYNIYRAREISRMTSSVRIGDCAITLKLRARSLIGQFLVYALSLIGAGIVLAIAAAAIYASLRAEGMVGEGSKGVAAMLQGGWFAIGLLVFGYLTVIGTFTLLGEVFLGCGFWMLMCRGASFTNADSLRSVRGRGEDRSLAGEGLADALNVGAY